eukprot:8057-Heterococcus_DN1.PRE.2
MPNRTTGTTLGDSATFSHKNHHAVGSDNSLEHGAVAQKGSGSGIVKNDNQGVAFENIDNDDVKADEEALTKQNSHYSSSARCTRTALLLHTVKAWSLLRVVQYCTVEVAVPACMPTNSTDKLLYTNHILCLMHYYYYCYTPQYYIDSFKNGALPNEVQLEEVEGQSEVAGTEPVVKSSSEDKSNKNSNFALEVGSSILRSAGGAFALPAWIGRKFTSRGGNDNAVKLPELTVRKCGDDISSSANDAMDVTPKIMYTNTDAESCYNACEYSKDYNHAALMCTLFKTLLQMHSMTLTMNSQIQKNKDYVDNGGSAAVAPKPHVPSTPTRGSMGTKHETTLDSMDVNPNNDIQADEVVKVKKSILMRYWLTKAIKNATNTIGRKIANSALARLVRNTAEYRARNEFAEYKLANELGNGVGGSQQSASTDDNTTLSSDTTKSTTTSMVSAVISAALSLSTKHCRHTCADTDRVTCACMQTLR